VEKIEIIKPYYKIFVYIIFVLFLVFISFNNYYYLREYLKYKFSYIFLFISFLICIFSFLNFKLNILQNFEKSSSNIVFVLDVSKSMLALDYKNNSRLSVAKEFIKTYVLNNLSNKYSLSIFSGDAMNIIPLTSDKNLFLTFLDSTDEKSILK